MDSWLKWGFAMRVIFGIQDLIVGFLYVSVITVRKERKSKQFWFLPATASATTLLPSLLQPISHGLALVACLDLPIIFSFSMWCVPLSLFLAYSVCAGLLVGGVSFVFRACVSCPRDPEPLPLAHTSRRDTPPSTPRATRAMS